MWLDPERENPIIGMKIREEGISVWRTVGLYTIKGFTYEKGNEYELLVKKTTLANPPQDDVNVRYEKNAILRKITDFSWQNMCFLYFVASNWGQQSLKPKYEENSAIKRGQSHTCMSFVEC